MRLVVITIIMLFATPSLAAEVLPVAKFKGWQGPKPEKAPCKCRARDGNKVLLGAKVCMKRGDSFVTMQCRLVLNNTSWEKVDDGCEVAML